jgi:hypothetical protein
VVPWCGPSTRTAVARGPTAGRACSPVVRTGNANGDSTGKLPAAICSIVLAGDKGGEGPVGTDARSWIARQTAAAMGAAAMRWGKLCGGK